MLELGLEPNLLGLQNQYSEPLWITVEMGAPDTRADAAWHGWDTGS